MRNTDAKKVEGKKGTGDPIFAGSESFFTNTALPFKIAYECARDIGKAFADAFTSRTIIRNSLKPRL